MRGSAMAAAPFTDSVAAQQAHTQQQVPPCEPCAMLQRGVASNTGYTGNCHAYNPCGEVKTAQPSA